MPRVKVAGWRQLLSDLLGAELFSGHAVPNIRNFIDGNNEKLKTIIVSHHDYTALKNHDLLWVNLFINPDMMFCHKDAVEGKYSDFFAPIILTNSNSAKSLINQLHSDFQTHYSTHPDQRTFSTFSDLEASGIITAPPKGGEMVGITFDKDSNTVTLHPDDSYSGHLETISDSDDNDKFLEYVKKVTNDGEWAYYIYSAGYNGNGESDQEHHTLLTITNPTISMISKFFR